MSSTHRSLRRSVSHPLHVQVWVLLLRRCSQGRVVGVCVVSPSNNSSDLLCARPCVTGTNNLDIMTRIFCRFYCYFSSYIFKNYILLLLDEEVETLRGWASCPGHETIDWQNEDLNLHCLGPEDRLSVCHYVAWEAEAIWKKLEGCSPS